VNPRHELAGADADTTIIVESGCDSFAIWMKLMEVVEAQYPTWPKRELMTAGDFRM
jgi:hypothetical protein